MQGFYTAYTPTLYWLSEYNCSFQSVKYLGSAVLPAAATASPVRIADVRAACWCAGERNPDLHPVPRRCKPR